MGHFGQNIIRNFAPRTPKAKAESESYEALLIALVTVAARHSSNKDQFINEVSQEVATRLTAESSEGARKICARMLEMVKARLTG